MGDVADVVAPFLRRNVSECLQPLCNRRHNCILSHFIPILSGRGGREGNH